MSQVLGWAGWLFFSICMLLLGWKLLRKRLTSFATKILSHRSQSSGSSKHAPIWFSLFCIAGMVYGYSRLPKPTIVTEHHVAIRARLDNGDFAYISDEKPAGDTYRPCSVDHENGIDVDGMLTQAVGYVADYATWQEQGSCRSILRPEWLFAFRDQANNFTYQRRAQ